MVCFAEKNNGATRAWHELKVIHNVQFNGKLAYEAGIESLNQAHTDNFATILPLYPVSDHTAAEASASSMDQAIEKCRKAIKLHSVKSRPKVNPKKRNNAKYQNWLKNKEFNNQMYRAWLLLGQSEFFKGDFLGAVGTFRYVEKLYENDPNMVALCQLWVARAYGELGWIYEAEDVLSKVKVDDLKQRYKPFYSAVSADILLKGGHEKEAIPFIKVAKQDEQRKGYLPRFEYVLAQLYELDNQREAARGAYKRVYRLHPADVLMEFNARIHYAELQGDTVKTVKRLERMARLYKYRDHLDQLYGTIGNIYLNYDDTVRALQYYQKGIKAATKNSNEKAQILVQAGDLYYDRNEYSSASPCYKEAVTILSTDHVDYSRVQHRSEVLDEVVVEENTVALQDSLQYLGTLSDEEQLKIVNQLIADLLEQEKQDSISQAEQARQEELEAESDGPATVNTSKMIGNRMGEAANWYFYNPQLMRDGKQEFTRKWGNRALEDNWRRMSKATSTTSTPQSDATTQVDAPSLSLSTTMGDDSTSSASPEPPTQVYTDIHNPEYYLQQIPKTEADYAASNQQIADALYNLIFIYRDKVKNDAKSEECWEDFCRRFPKEERLPSLYYDRYLTALRYHNDSLARACREAILRAYPESDQAKIVSNPNYFESLRRMAVEQDSLYAATYAAYKHGQYMTVKKNKQYVDTTYPLTPLMPRFLFLNAIAEAKTGGQAPFKVALQDMVDRYPENELSAMAKDMLALISEGKEAKRGGSTSTLETQREASVEPETEAPMLAKSFSVERKEHSLVYIVISSDADQLNELLYEVALFNFTQFLVKDFDLRKVEVFTPSHSALEISGLESMDEAEWYMSLLQENTDLHVLLTTLAAEVVPITESNIQLVNHPFTLEEYIRFYQKK